MPSLVYRIVVGVKVWLAKHWKGEPGETFRATVGKLSEAASKHIDSSNAADIAVESVRRVAIGKISHDHSEVVRNYAEEERTRIEAELARRTLRSQVRQSESKAEQEELTIRKLRDEEMLRRLELFAKLQEKNLMPIWDGQGRMTMVRPSKDFDWNGVLDALVSPDEFRDEPPKKRITKSNRRRSKKR
jgi:hypothetical protein